MMKSKNATIKKVKGYSSAYPNICNLKLLPNINGGWITIQDDVGTSMTIKLSDLSDFICYEEYKVLDKIKIEIRKKMNFNSFNEGYVLYDDIIRVLDKYKAEGSDKK